MVILRSQTEDRQRPTSVSLGLILDLSPRRLATVNSRPLIQSCVASLTELQAMS